jgi:hypothetical protein
LGRELYRISGVDLTRIDGIDVGVAQTVISEIGLRRAKAAVSLVARPRFAAALNNL